MCCKNIKQDLFGQEGLKEPSTGFTGSRPYATVPWAPPGLILKLSILCASLVTLFWLLLHDMYFVIGSLYLSMSSFLLPVILPFFVLVSFLSLAFLDSAYEWDYNWLPYVVVSCPQCSLSLLHMAGLSFGKIICLDMCTFSLFSHHQTKRSFFVSS